MVDRIYTTAHSPNFPFMPDSIKHMNRKKVSCKDSFLGKPNKEGRTKYYHNILFSLLTTLIINLQFT